jgi:hypothetical protein
MALIISRRSFEKLVVSAGASLLVPTFARADTDGGFVHPGMLHSSADLARMQGGVRDRSQPILSGFEAMSASAESQLSYKRKGASAEISRNPNSHAGDFEQDANAAYQCSLMWTITGDARYAQLAMAILDDWAATLKSISGADAVLCAALGGFKMVNAAEILRYTHALWPYAKVRQFEELLRSAFCQWKLGHSRGQADDGHRHLLCRAPSLRSRRKLLPAWLRQRSPAALYL